MKLVDLNIFDREVTCTYRGETYRVRDNGAVFRRRRDRARLRPLDEKWTFGRANKKRGYMHVASIPVHRIVATAFRSIENFLANPDRPISGKLPPNFEWMRSVTKKEAEESRRRLLDWAKSGGMPSGGTLGEWLYTSRTNSMSKGQSLMI